jgi:hypothetical protein
MNKPRYGLCHVAVPPTPSRISRLLFACLCLSIVAEPDACAYSDPGSGALIWQGMLAALFGLLFYVRRFVNWFNSRKEKRPGE